MKHKAIITLTSDSTKDGCDVAVEFKPEISDKSKNNTAAFLALELVKVLPKIANGTLKTD